MVEIASSAIDGSDLTERLLRYLEVSAQPASIDGADDSVNELTLSDAELAIVREVLVGHETMAMRGFQNGPVHAWIVRMLMRLRDRLEDIHGTGKPGPKFAQGAANALAYGYRSLPRLVRPKFGQWQMRLFPGEKAERRIRAEAYRRGLPLDPLLKVVTELPQTRECRTFLLNEKQNIAVGVVVGFDLMKCNDRWAVIEANNGIGQNDQWTIRGKDNPFIEHILEFAAAHNFRNVCIINNDRGLRGMQDELYHNAARRAGIEVEIVEPSSVPSTRHRRSSIIPEMSEPDTLCVRIRSFRAWADFILSNKQSVHESLQSYFLANDIQSLFVPDNAPGWLDRVAWDSGPYPNIVAKLPRADHGVGVAFYKAKDREHALELARSEDDAEFRMGGLHGKLERAAKRGEKFLQAFQPSNLSADGRLGIYRMTVLITPVGNKMLSVTKAVAPKSVPESLPYGVVMDSYPYLVNGGAGAKRYVPDPEEVAELEPVAEILAKANAEILERIFFTTDHG